MDPNAAAPIAGPQWRKVKITNPHGFHLRPMQAFVELAAKFQCAVTLRRDELEPVDGKSIWSMMLLGAEQGTELTVEVEGADGPVALEELTDFLANLESRVKLDTPD
jgi:phosphocarrier protein HPr